MATSGTGGGTSATLAMVFSGTDDEVVMISGTGNDVVDKGEAEDSRAASPADTVAVDGTDAGSAIAKSAASAGDTSTAETMGAVSTCSPGSDARPNASASSVVAAGMGTAEVTVTGDASEWGTGASRSRVDSSKSAFKATVWGSIEAGVSETSAGEFTADEG